MATKKVDPVEYKKLQAKLRLVDRELFKGQPRRARAVLMRVSARYPDFGRGEINNYEESINAILRRRHDAINAPASAWDVGDFKEIPDEEEKRDNGHG